MAQAHPGNNVVAALLGVLRGAWGWALGRPFAKVILGRSVGELSWATPPVSTPASAVASALLVAAAGSRADAERIVAGLIAVLLSWRSYELYASA